MTAAASPAVSSAPPNSGEIVTPGERLGTADSCISGRGTHIIAGIIYSSTTGFRQQQQQPAGKTVLSASSLRPPIVVPQPSDIVTARVTKINPRYASCSILSIGRHLLPAPFPGLIRQRDIRSFDIDNAEVVRAFRPGDLVLASVLSLGDARAYYLSTAATELGVVEAVSAAGAAMRPLSWEKMQCSVTGAKEYRKVAKTAEATQAAAAAAAAVDKT